MVQNMCLYCTQETNNPKFCSRSCSAKYNNSKRRLSEETKDKIRQSSREYYRTHLCIRKKPSLTSKRLEYLERIKNESNRRPVKAYNGDILNITKAELEEYRKRHLVCEICGRAEKSDTTNKHHKKQYPNKLCADHNHAHKRFRGLLCSQCNRNLGWFENLEQEIYTYLKRDQ